MPLGWLQALLRKLNQEYDNMKVTEDEGLDYILTVMSASYGAAFMRHWEGLDFNLVREAWKKNLGKYLIWREALDHALVNMPPRFVPTPMEFHDLCLDYGPIWKMDQPKVAKIAKAPEPTELEREEMAYKAEQARKMISEFIRLRKR